MLQQSVKRKQLKPEQILAAGEEVDVAFKLVRDLIVFTDKRLLLVDKKALPERK